MSLRDRMIPIAQRDLFTAIRAGSVGWARDILEEFSPDAQEPIHDGKMVIYGPQTTALWVALARNQIGIATWLLEHGAQFDGLHRMTIKPGAPARAYLLREYGVRDEYVGELSDGPTHEFRIFCPAPLLHQCLRHVREHRDDYPRELLGLPEGLRERLADTLTDNAMWRWLDELKRPKPVETPAWGERCFRIGFAVVFACVLLPAIRALLFSP